MDQNAQRFPEIAEMNGIEDTEHQVKGLSFGCGIIRKLVFMEPLDFYPTTRFYLSYS